MSSSHPISFLSAPGSSISTYNRTRTVNAEQPNQSSEDAVPSNSSIPRAFLDAMDVREKVFVEEQHVPLENELDADDPRCFHWVAYADSPISSSPAIPMTNKSKTSTPIGTIRLVPPPHPPHASPGTSHSIDNSEDAPKVSTDEDEEEETYIKLGRLAVKKEYRGLGLAKTLLDTALDWAAANAREIDESCYGSDSEHKREEGKRWKGLVLVHAQSYLEFLYARWGFVKDEKMGAWIEEGIEHVGMWRRIDLK